MSAQRFGLSLLNAAVSQGQVASPIVQIPVPGVVDRRAQEFAPFDIETAVAARDVAITQDDGLRKRLARGRPDEITDVRVASGESPVGRGFILNPPGREEYEAC